MRQYDVSFFRPPHPEMPRRSLKSVDATPESPYIHRMTAYLADLKKHNWAYSNGRVPGRTTEERSRVIKMLNLEKNVSCKQV